MNEIPDEQTCLDLLQQVGCSQEVINHSKEVSRLAVTIAEKAKADVNLVRAGALLHDIGRSKSHAIDHAIKGAQIAKDLDLPLEIITIIQRHIGAGLDSNEAGRFHLPRKDYRPQTLEEKIICHADNLIHDTKRQPIEVKVEKALIKGKHDYALKLVKLHKELSDICGIDLNTLL